jgi:hypothetical protein
MSRGCCTSALLSFRALVGMTDFARMLVQRRGDRDISEYGNMRGGAVGITKDIQPMTAFRNHSAQFFLGMPRSTRFDPAKRDWSRSAEARRLALSQD